MLFGGTIKENICFAVDSVDETEYDLAVKSAQLTGEIADFPEETKPWWAPEVWASRADKSSVLLSPEP